jgi:hypothetical protein
MNHKEFGIREELIVCIYITVVLFEGHVDEIKAAELCVMEANQSRLKAISASDLWEKFASTDACVLKKVDILH